MTERTENRRKLNIGEHGVKIYNTKKKSGADSEISILSRDIWPGNRSCLPSGGKSVKISWFV